MKRELKIGNIQFDNPFFLAPLAGITDAPTRRICREMGAALVYSEMVSAKGLYYGDRKTERLLFTYPEEAPVAYQIFGSDPKIMAFAAQELDGRENVILDVNMGCPVPKIVKNGEGSALMKDPDLVYRIVKAMTDVTEKPVTIKTRIGFDENSLNVVDVALAAEAGGAAAVCVHGRTRQQFYSGEAAWEHIARVKKAVKIPVIGNGDIVDGASGMKMLSETDCDFAMVGRGALGNPWIFRELAAAWNGSDITVSTTVEDRKSMMIRHLSDIAELKGDYAAVREMRKFVGWYIKGLPGSAALRGRINTIDDIDELKDAIRGL